MYISKQCLRSIVTFCSRVLFKLNIPFDFASIIQIAKMNLRIWKWDTGDNTHTRNMMEKWLEIRGKSEFGRVQKDMRTMQRIHFERLWGKYTEQNFCIEAAKFHVYAPQDDITSKRVFGTEHRSYTRFVYLYFYQFTVI